MLNLYLRRNAALSGTTYPKLFLTFPPEAPSSYLLAGGFYQSHGEAEKALGLYRTGLATDSEHKLDNMDSEAAFESFFAGADLVICDTMYSLGDTVSLKQDWGHSSNIVAIDLCLAAAAKRLALFHHEPTYSDGDIQRFSSTSIRRDHASTPPNPEIAILAKLRKSSGSAGGGDNGGEGTTSSDMREI